MRLNIDREAVAGLQAELTSICVSGHDAFEFVRYGTSYSRPEMTVDLDPGLLDRTGHQKELDLLLFHAEDTR
jgi:hypothetical protein